ncbi:MAG: hypothetical protein Q8P67_18415 [archaeon]|nr:hypothetical protein [archaeon]
MKNGKSAEESSTNKEKAPSVRTIGTSSKSGILSSVPSGTGLPRTSTRGMSTRSLKVGTETCPTCSTVL